MIVEEMLARMSSREFCEWLAFYRIEQFGTVREDLRAGEIASAIGNVSGVAKRAYRPRDFFADTLDQRPLAMREPPGSRRMTTDEIFAEFDRATGFQPTRGNKSGGDQLQEIAH